jgi:hypothetical protein
MFLGNWNIDSSCEISLGYGFFVSRNMGLENHWKGSIRKTALEGQHWKDSIGRTALEGQHWEEQHWEEQHWEEQHWKDRIWKISLGIRLQEREHWDKTIN